MLRSSRLPPVLWLRLDIPWFKRFLDWFCNWFWCSLRHFYLPFRRRSIPCSANRWRRRSRFAFEVNFRSLAGMSVHSAAYSALRASLRIARAMRASSASDNFFGMLCPFHSNQEDCGPDSHRHVFFLCVLIFCLLTQVLRWTQPPAQVHYAAPPQPFSF